MSFTCSCCVCHCFLFTKDTQDMVNGNARTLDSTVLAAICKQPFLYTAHRNYLQRSWQLTATCPLHFLQRYQAFNELPTNVKALGITITSQLAMNLHVNTLLESCGKNSVRPTCTPSTRHEWRLHSRSLLLHHYCQADIRKSSLHGARVADILSRRSLRSVGTNQWPGSAYQQSCHSFIFTPRALRS